MTDVTIIDNTDIVKKRVEENVKVALEMMGLTCEAYAKDNCPVDTGRLRASIRHEVEEHYAIIGTDVEYSTYVEMGTSRQEAQPYLRPAVEEHLKEYETIVRSLFDIK